MVGVVFVDVRRFRGEGSDRIKDGMRFFFSGTNLCPISYFVNNFSIINFSKHSHIRSGFSSGQMQGVMTDVKVSMKK